MLCPLCNDSLTIREKHLYCPVLDETRLYNHFEVYNGTSCYISIGSYQCRFDSEKLTLDICYKGKFLLEISNVDIDPYSKNIQTTLETYLFFL